MRFSLLKLKRATMLAAVFVAGNSFVLAQSAATHCDPTFTGSNIGANFAPPDGNFQTVTGNCTGNPGCEDFFDLTCAGGEVVFLSFCQLGGTADFDTGLSTWDAGDIILECNDDSCALLSELIINAATGFQRVRIGGFGGASGTYTLAFQAPATCSIAGAVAIEPGPDGLPGTHNLSSVYPNPFNPQARFTLEVAEQQSVRIAVYDALGREVATLHNGTLMAGPAHEFTIDAELLPSGRYLVQVIGEQFFETRSATLLR